VSDVKIENCLVGNAYEIHVKSGGSDCGSERIQIAIDMAKRLNADVVLQPGIYKLERTIRLLGGSNGMYIFGKDNDE